MNVSRKCQYALRAIYELSSRLGAGPTSVAEIASVQAIPPRFLELILRQLRQGGFVESRRGVSGGYLLSVPPRSLNVGAIIRFIDGPIGPVQCTNRNDEAFCSLEGERAFMGMWSRVRDAVAAVYDETTFQDLIDEKNATGQYVGSYCI